MIFYDEYNVSLLGYVGDMGVFGNLVNGKIKVVVFIYYLL